MNDLKWYEKPITQNQLASLNRLLGEFTKDRDCKLFVATKLVKRETPLMSTKELTVGEWGVIRDGAHPWWRDDDWDLDRHYAAKIQMLVEEYQETVLGQIRMF